MFSNWAVFAGVGPAGTDGVRAGSGTGGLTGAAKAMPRGCVSPSRLAAPLMAVPAFSKVPAKRPPIRQPGPRLSPCRRGTGGSVPTSKTNAGFGRASLHHGHSARGRSLAVICFMVKVIRRGDRHVSIS